MKISSCLLSIFLLFKTISLQGQTDSLIIQLESYLEELAQNEYFGLSISVVKQDTLRLQKAYGYANRAHKVPNQPSTCFNIASIGKLFTAVAILQLKDQGKIQLEERVGQYLPEFPNAYIRDSVSIHQLLTHSSGLPLWFTPTFDRKPKFDYLELKDYLNLYRGMMIRKSKVGRHYYSNAGYLLLGYVIEEVSQLSYKDYLNQHIFQPLEMQATNLWPLTAIIPHAATGYVRPANKEEEWTTNYHLNMGSSPAGGAYASTGDLIRFFQALTQHQLLRPETTQLMLTPQIKTIDGHYGYGIWLNTHNDQRIIGHLGGYYGARGELMWYPDAGYLIAILANSDQTDYIDVSYFLKMALTGTDEEKAAYRNTRQLIKRHLQEKLDLEQSAAQAWRQKAYDETLIQIKAYYYFNNQQYALARQLFKLNRLLFPNSESAKRDDERASKE